MLFVIFEFDVLKDSVRFWKFFLGFALRIFRNRYPERFRTSAMTLGEGNSSGRKPCLLSSLSAAAAVNRVNAIELVKVGSCWQWASASFCNATNASRWRSSQRFLPLKPDWAPTQRRPVRFSPNPVSTVLLLQPNTVSVSRGLPLQYLSAISAWNARRRAPVIFEEARCRSSIWVRDNSIIMGTVRLNKSASASRISLISMNKKVKSLNLRF